MAFNTDKSKLVDGVLRAVAAGTLTAAIILAPNSLQLFDGPIQNYLKKLDKARREKELKEAYNHLRRMRLISEDYELGIQLTQKGKKRIAQREFHDLALPKNISWDGHWRVIFFDIPEKHKTARDAFAAQIRRMGFKVLQRSVFVYPFECRKEIELLTSHYQIGKYTTYIEARFTDNEEYLKTMFKSVLK